MTKMIGGSRFSTQHSTSIDSKSTSSNTVSGGNVGIKLSVDDVTILRDFLLSNLHVSVDDVLKQLQREKGLLEAGMKGVAEVIALSGFGARCGIAPDSVLWSFLVPTTQLYNIWQQLGWQLSTETFRQYVVRLFVCMCTFHRVQLSAQSINNCKFATLNASSTRALIRAMMKCGIVAVYSNATIPSCIAEPNIEKRQRCVRNVVLLQQVENLPSSVEWFMQGV
jgi:hypothetical protein